MAKTKRDKERNQKLINFKNKNKRMAEETKVNMSGQDVPQLPEVREQPYWAATEELVIKGIEFQALYNGVTQITEMMQAMFGASQAVMQRNLLNGKIRVRFEKLVNKTDEQGNSYQDYELMSDEEQAPHIENFNKLVESIKLQKENPTPQPEAPMLDGLVDQNGEPINGGNKAIVDAIGNPISNN